MFQKHNTIEKIKALKSNSGSHSPSIDTLKVSCPEIKIDIDACFLSNPYATELFMDHLRTDLISTEKLRSVLEFYPPQNAEVAKLISSAIGVSEKNIFVGNGAIEIIQAVIQAFVKKKICVIIPTFSSYYEFVGGDVEIIYYKLIKDHEFKLDVNHYMDFIKKHSPDAIVIINPNNPNGSYLSSDEIKYILNESTELGTVILDESFIHFAFEQDDYSQVSCEKLVNNYPNLVIIKSMSKDFGIAGLRAGYSVMEESRVKRLLSSGFLWNISGLANYFFTLYSNESFLKLYENLRKKYITETILFINELRSIQGIRVFPSKANFALIEIIDGRSSFDVFSKLLVNYNIYVRDCSDKIGLQGEFIRIASRTRSENDRIIKVLSEI